MSQQITALGKTTPNPAMSLDELAEWLRETDENKLGELYELADRTRRERVGDEVWLRGLVEISSYCRRKCLYCGLRAPRQIERYRMTRQEILESAATAARFQYGTLVIQSGEDLTLDENFIAELVEEIKSRYDLAITLSLGERKDSEFIRWKKAGADRYLLRFETSNPKLYRAIHPQASETAYVDRIETLKRLREIGYEIGGGVMIGLPGQTYSDLARDLAAFRELDLDMIGCGPFLPHSGSPLGRLEKQDGYWRELPAEETRTPMQNASTEETRTPMQNASASASPRFEYPASPDQVPNTNAMAYKVVALTRILCPDSNIPSTTAVATLDAAGGRKGALERGANVIMPNVTPEKYRRLYEIYPNKAATREDSEATRNAALKQIAEIGRRQGIGPGAAPRFKKVNRD